MNTDYIKAVAADDLSSVMENMVIRANCSSSNRAGAPSGLSPSVSGKAAHRFRKEEEK